MIRIGVCAFTGHRGLYPPGLPPANRLRYYSSEFDVVEVDVPFYRPLAPEYAKRWVESVPASFRFDVKAPGSLTGHRPFDADELRAFRRLVAPIADAGLLGAVLVQWPPWHRDSPAARRRVEIAREALAPYRVAVEFRHASWFHDPGALAAWIRRLDASLVVVDAPDVGAASIPWIPLVTLPALAYVRFHGRNRETWFKPGLRSSQERFRYRYTAEELGARTPDLLALSREADEVHVLMNNNYGSYAVDGARWLRDALVPRPGTQMAWTLDG